jgi:hypothetical protein
MLTDDQAHALATYIHGIDRSAWQPEPVDPIVMANLLQWLAGMPNPGALWRNLRNPGELAETIAAVFYEQATTCPKSSNGRHTSDSAQPVAVVIDRSRALHSDAGACRYCHFSGDACCAELGNVSATTD